MKKLNSHYWIQSEQLLASTIVSFEDIEARIAWYNIDKHLNGYYWEKNNNRTDRGM